MLDPITYNGSEDNNLLTELQSSIQIMNRILVELPPTILGEHYLTTDQVMAYLQISRRTLQNYRDNGIIPYTVIGRNILYPESKIRQILEQNYYSPEIK